MTVHDKISGRVGAAGCLVLVQILLISCCISAGCSGNVMNGSSVIVPHISPVDGMDDPEQPSYTFPFEDAAISLSLPVDGSVYAGAKAADKGVTIYGNVSESDWIARSYLAMIDDPNQDGFYDSLLERLSQARREMALSDDEFADLLAVFVQSIPYETTPDNPAKFPVETFVEKSGDCDDKSLLLAALLSREGFRTALLSFPNESHMAVGIACGDRGYRNTGYAYIETTNLSFIGVPPDDLADGAILRSDPVVIPVGNGSKIYDSCKQTASLHAVYLETEERFYNLSKRAEKMRSDLKNLSEDGNIGAYNREVLEFNSDVAEMNRVASIHNYIAGHQYDRNGTYAWVMAHPLQRPSIPLRSSSLTDGS